jgi:hypothetical protein
MKPRPSSVMVLGALTIVGGILSFIGGWWLMVDGSVGSAFGAASGTAVLILGSLMFGTGLASLAVGYGLWALRHWAWSGAFVVFCVSIFIDAVSVALAGANPLDVTVDVAVAVLVMWYLLQPRMRAVYGH